MYYFRVQAQNTAGAGAWTYISNGALASSTPPGAPTSVTAAMNSSSTVAVSFELPSDTGDSAITDFDVEYSTDPQFQAGSGTFFEGGTTTANAVYVTGLTNGVTYYFRVRAQNAFGTLTGPWSLVSNGAYPYTTPDAPGSVYVYQRPGNSFYVTWPTPNNGGSAITDYRVGYGISSSATSPTTIFADGVSTNTNATVTGLTNGETYYLFVCAVNAAGCSSWSRYGGVVAIDTPGTATNVKAVSGSVNSVRVSFTAPTSNGGNAIFDYDVEYSTDPAFAAGSGTFFEGGTTTVGYVDVTGLTLGVVYYFRVRAQNSAGSGAWTYITNGSHG